MKQVTWTEQQRTIVSRFVARRKRAEIESWVKFGAKEYGLQTPVEILLRGLADLNVKPKFWWPCPDSTFSRLKRHLGIPPQKKGVLVKLREAGFASMDAFLRETADLTDLQRAKKLGYRCARPVADARNKFQRDLEAEWEGRILAAAQKRDRNGKPCRATSVTATSVGRVSR